jgi:polysaccharide biosynthesis protein PelA
MRGAFRRLLRKHAGRVRAAVRRPNFEHLFMSCMRALRLILFFLFVFDPFACAASAQPETSTAEPVRREILALYDSRDEAHPDQTRIHRFAEMPLNHLGFVVSYWDINRGMPVPERTAKLRGILTWFRRAPPAAFYAWGIEQIANGVRTVVIGDAGLPFGTPSFTEANRLFGAIGFALSGSVADITYAARVLYRDELIGFERELDPVLPAFPITGTQGADVTSHLVLEHREGNQVFASSVVLTSSRGGYVANSYFVYEEPVSGRTKWIVDPFAFFRKAFDAQLMPIPDVTTLSGRRLWFSHIDGDGWNNISYIEEYRETPTVAASVVLHKLIEPYPDLPVAVGVIGADVDDRYGVPEAGRKAARELFALPQVEVASHTYSHPYKWSFFENYDRKLEERLVSPDETEWTAILGDRFRRIAHRLFPGLTRKPDVEAGKAEEDPPRAYSEFPFDLEQEMGGSIAAAEELAPEGKRATIYLWSGGAEPFEDAIARTRRLGLRNLNGGDSRFDADYPSITYLAPISRTAGTQRQIYAGNANDYIYITDGQGREHGFLNLDATIAATETPRRLKPVNVYYHMYAGERPAQLAAVRHHLDAARQAALTPVSASHYAAIADGFFSTEMTRVSELGWQIRNRGALQTVRFDDASTLRVDFSQSVGVLGESRRGASLYVALDEAVEEAVVTLTREPPSPVQTPYLADGRWMFRDLRRKECGFAVTATGYGTGQMTWGGLRPGSYLAVARDAKEAVWDEELEVGEDGRLKLSVDAEALSPLDIEVRCFDGQGEP